MSAVGAGMTQLMVGLIAGRTLRAQCLARFLELSGLGIRIVALESIGPGLPGQIDALDLAIIDTGEQTCRDPDIRRGFTCLRDALPGIPVVVLSDREDWSAVIAALNLGARAYFPSSLDPDILVETLRFVQKGGTFIPIDVLIRAPVHRTRSPRAEARRTAVGGLTASEQRVLDLLRKGKPNKAIARELDIEETTVKVHVRRIMKKLHAANRTQAALAAQRMADAVVCCRSAEQVDRHSAVIADPHPDLRCGTGVWVKALCVTSRRGVRRQDFGSTGQRSNALDL